MKHFENNIMDGQSTVGAINDLNELSGAVSVNALMVAEGECEPSKTDAGAWWSLIALAEAALSRFPEGMRREGYELVNKNVDRELVEKARRDEAEQAAKRVMSIIFWATRPCSSSRSAWTARTPSRR